MSKHKEKEICTFWRNAKLLIFVTTQARKEHFRKLFNSIRIVNKIFYQI